jgi:DNA processing protein
LSKCGVCVVSGGALGVDGAAHRGALKADGITVSVLGCGVNYDYPKENADIRREIPRHGALVSE